MNQQYLSSFERLPRPARLVLLSLRDHPMGGRELLAFLEATQRWLEPGVVWVALRRLESAGLISPLESDQQTHRYDVTDAGRSALPQEGNTFFGEPELAGLALGGLERSGLQPSRGGPSGWNMLLIKWMVRLYPKAWRERYGQELLDLLGVHETTFWTWLDLLFNAINARLDPYYRRSAPLETLPHLRRVQRTILVAFLLPLFSAWFYFYLFLNGLHADYWVRNQRYLLLATIHDLGTIGMQVTFFSAVLVCILFAYLGIERFGRSSDAPFHRLILVTMCLPVAVGLLELFSPILPDDVAIPLFVGSLLLNSLLLIGWGVVRRETFKQAFLYLTPALGNLLYPPPHDTPPYYLPIALLALLSAPLSFALAMVLLRLDTRARSTLLTLVTVETLGMTLVQLMMALRLLVLYVLGLSTIWTSELIMTLGVNVLATVLALVCLLPRRRQAPPSSVGAEVVVTPIV